MKNLIRSAYNALIKGRVEEADRLLESILKNGHEPYPMFLSAIALFSNDHLDKALSLNKRLRSYYPDYLPGKELDAFIKLKSAATRDEAVVAYVELSPGGSEGSHFDKMAGRIRSARDFPAYQKKLRVVDCVRLKRYRPGTKYETNPDFDDRIVAKKKIHKKVPLLRYIFIVLVLASVAIVSYLYFSGGLTKKPEAAKFDQTDIPQGQYPIIGKQSVDERFIYVNEESVRKDFAEAKILTRDGHYNKALLILNRIMLSNAQPSVKDRVNFLRSYIRDSENRDVEQIDISTLMKDPLVYQGLLVRINGKIVEKSSREGGDAYTISADEAKGISAYIFIKHGENILIGDHVVAEGIFTQLIGNRKIPYIEARSLKRE
jgi:hypothetical protein